MSGSGFTLTGIENLLKIFHDFPEGGYRKPVIAAFRKAAEPVKQAMVENIPSNIKPVKKAIKIKPGKGRSLTLAVGVFAGVGLYRNRRGQLWDPYQLVLWHNYGTLDWRANRFYEFKTPVRQKTSAGSMVGIKPKLFIERAWEQSKISAQKNFETTVDIEITKFLEKNAAQ